MSLRDAFRKMFAKPYESVHPQQVGALLDDRRAVLLDVRERQEWQAGHAPAARHIPLAELPIRSRELPAGRPVVTVCRSGGRSARAAAMLAAEGHEVFNLAGGMAAWARAGLPLKGSGGPGRVI